MPKFKKESVKEKKRKRKTKTKEEFAFKTVVVSAILAGMFLIASVFLNGGIIRYFMNRDIYWTILDVTLKVTVILLCFSFMMISLGNYKELTGKPVRTKEILYLFGLALVQTFRDLWVFFITLIGLITILIYLFLVQEHQ